jgi:hypothetical protein
VTKAVLLFLAAFALYFFTHSPALDDIDAVQFAMGVRSFDLWHHQPHPPGYPLFIFFGWLGRNFSTPERNRRFTAFRHLAVAFSSRPGSRLFALSFPRSSHGGSQLPCWLRQWFG